MFARHDLRLVALSEQTATPGGYTGSDPAARIGAKPGVSRHGFLAGAAVLAIGVSALHFIGLPAAPTPVDTIYLLLAIITFLICVRLLTTVAAPGMRGADGCGVHLNFLPTTRAVSMH